MSYKSMNIAIKSINYAWRATGAAYQRDIISFFVASSDDDQMLEIKFYGPCADRCKPDRLVSSTLFPFFRSRLLAIKRRNSFNFDHFPFDVYFTHELCNIVVCNGIDNRVLLRIWSFTEHFNWTVISLLVDRHCWMQFIGRNGTTRHCCRLCRMGRNFSYICDVIMSTYKYFMQMSGYVRNAQRNHHSTRFVRFTILNWISARRSRILHAFNSWPNDRKG